MAANTPQLPRKSALRLRADIEAVNQLIGFGPHADLEQVGSSFVLPKLACRSNKSGDGNEISPRPLIERRHWLGFELLRNFHRHSRTRQRQANRFAWRKLALVCRSPQSAAARPYRKHPLRCANRWRGDHRLVGCRAPNTSGTGCRHHRSRSSRSRQHSRQHVDAALGNRSSAHGVVGSLRP